MKILAIVILAGIWSAGPPAAFALRAMASHADGPQREGARLVRHEGPPGRELFVGHDRPAGGGRYAQDPAPAAAAAPTGDARRGKSLFDQTYRCYACHGFDGETGSPRLVPMSRTEESFTSFLRTPPRPAMPAFSDVPAKDLADVYAYLRSLRSTAPAAASIPLLSDILQQIAARR